jgi:hypothetical protein
MLKTRVDAVPRSLRPIIADMVKMSETGEDELSCYRLAPEVGVANSPQWFQREIRGVIDCLKRQELQSAIVLEDY